MGSLSCKNCSEKENTGLDNLNCETNEKKENESQTKIKVIDDFDPFLIENNQLSAEPQPILTSTSPLNTSTNSKEQASQKTKGGSQRKNIDGRKSPLEIIDESRGETNLNDFLNDNKYLRTEISVPSSSRKINASFNSASLYKRYNYSIKKEKNWNTLTIFDCIPASKIENKENEDFLLQSEFYRVNCNKKTITKISEAYPNYLVLTFNSIKIYRSKEHFLYGRTPLTILPFSALALCDVINVNETSFKNIKNVFKYNFCIEINKEKIQSQNGDQSAINRIKNEGITKYESNNNMNQKDQKRKPKKMKLIESSKSNKVKGKVDPLSLVNNDDKTILSIISNLPDIITFSSCNQDVVYKWVYSINYLMKEAK